MKKHHQELSDYQKEIAHPRDSIGLTQSKKTSTPQKQEPEKTYFPDLLTPYQRALLRQDFEEIKKIEAEMQENKSKQNKPLLDAVILCYIAGMIISAGVCGGYHSCISNAKQTAKVQQTMQNALVQNKIHQR